MLKEENTEFNLPPVVEHYYEFCIWLLPKVSKFQKDQKYILGTRLQNTALDVLEHVISAALSPKPDKPALLKTALQKMEHVRYYLRIAAQVKMINPKSYAYGSEQVLKISKMLGAWKKSLFNEQ